MNDLTLLSFPLGPRLAQCHPTLKGTELEITDAFVMPLELYNEVTA